MKKSELKNMIKECVKEVLFEEGVLSNMIAEVAFGIAKAQSMLVENDNSVQVKKVQDTKKVEVQRQRREQEKRKTLLETKRKMLDAIGSNSMGNVFEGTEPLQQSDQLSHSPLAGRDPHDAGVDISGLFDLAGGRWKQLK